MSRRNTHIFLFDRHLVELSARLMEPLQLRRTKIKHRELQLLKLVWAGKQMDCIANSANRTCFS